jgi:predicted O-linked N-acetylglucosamine transferase (SPINDLY family)
VQASWLGYWASTGVPAMDYLLADSVCVPDEHRGDFTEHVWHLPETRLCFSPPEDAPPVAPLPALQAGHVTFGSFQSMVKLNGAVLALWARVLRAVPNSRLRLQALQFADDIGRAVMRRRLTDAGIDPASVDLAPPMSRAAYLAAHAQVDMILDTFPHTGGTTTCEALWMGVPTLALAGRSLLARQGASLLNAAGLMTWTALDEEDFVARATNFAADLSSLARLRRDLRNRIAASALFDARRFAMHLQNAIAQMAAASTTAEKGK